MTTNIVRFGALGLGALMMWGCSPSEQPLAAPQAATVETPALIPVTPGVSINAVMVALVDHASHNLWDAEQEGRAPKTIEDWQTIQEHAVQLAAAGPAISAGGTGPADAGWVNTPSWRVYAQRLSNAGKAASTAAQNRNFDALVVANGQLVESCESCHKEFKPALPTEGIVHTHSH